MIYVLTDKENNILKYPYNIGLLRKDNPNTSFPKVVTDQTLTAFGVCKVEEVKPEYSEAQKLIKPEQPVFSDGKWLLIWSVVDKSQEEIDNDLARAKTEKLSELLTSCDDDLKQLAKGYPERETQTWAVQLEEAKAYLADKTSPTPFINAALKDGETVEQYANLIVANNTAWSDYAGKVVLKRRTYESAINAATTIDELQAISW